VSPTGFTVLNPGSTYPASSTTVPVTFVGGLGAGGTAATGTAVTDATGKITGFSLSGVGSGYTSAPLVVISTTGIQQGADIAVQEQGIMNLLSVNTGTLGKFTATSENASIIQSGTLGVVVGNTTALTALNGGITLTNSANTFGGTAFGGGSILVSSGGNVSITDSSQNTVLNGNTNISGGLTLKNNYGAQIVPIGSTSSANSFGSIRDTPGTLTVAGPVVFDAGLYSGSIVNIGSAVASFGAITFKGGSVTILENSTLNIGAGSSAVGPVSLTSSGSIVTSGTANFQSSLNLNAGGNITISNSIFVQNGLTFKALGAVDLSALSLAGNLNSIVPINNGAGSYTKTPTP